MLVVLASIDKAQNVDLEQAKSGEFGLHSGQRDQHAAAE